MLYEVITEEQGGMVLKYTFEPIKKLHLNNAKDMVVILSTIAISVLFVSLMNYILLTLSALVNRAKASAIHKTVITSYSIHYTKLYDYVNKNLFSKL